MGYETRAVVVADAKKYTKKELEPWAEKWKEYIDDTLIEAHRIVFILDWSKRVHEATEDFELNYAHEDDNGFQEDDWGIILIGEDYDHVQEMGVPWEYDVTLLRDIEVY